NRAIRSEPVLDVERLAETVADLLRNGAALNIRTAAGGEANEDADWVLGIRLRPCAARECREDGSARGQMQELSAEKFHRADRMPALSAAIPHRRFRHRQLRTHSPLILASATNCAHLRVSAAMNVLNPCGVTALVSTLSFRN